MKNLDAQAVAALDQAHTLRPWTHFASHATQPPSVVARGEGCYLWDGEGRKYLDSVGGLWCTNIGQGRAEMAQTIAEQVQRLAYASTFVDCTNEPAALLSAKLAELAPGDLNHVHFTTGGSESVDSAFRMVVFVQRARGFADRTHVISRQHSYHGSTYAAMSLGKRQGDQSPEFAYETDNIHHVSAPELYRRPAGVSAEGLTDHLVAEFEAKIAEIGPERVAAFFAEPVQASGGVIVPPPDYLARMAAVCRRHGILFVADEVVTAFGRMGHWFASSGVYGVQPDIICTAKGLSSGYLPIGAVIFSDALWQSMAADDDRWFTSGFTYSGHPVACAAALKNIEIIEREGLLAAARARGAVFEAQLATLADLPLVGDVRSHTLIGCVENVADKATGALFDDAVDIGHRITHAAQGLGLMVRPIAHLNVMSPPLVITDDQIMFVTETLAQAIRQVADDLTREHVRFG